MGANTEANTEALLYNWNWLKLTELSTPLEFNKIMEFELFM